jgi:hypothetical protein
MRKGTTPSPITAPALIAMTKYYFVLGVIAFVGELNWQG